MKKVITLFFATLMMATAMSQNLTLRFTGRMNTGSYVQLDSVKVENLNRSWTEVLTYPDTVLTFDLTGIDQASASNVELKAFPNPFNGNTTLSLQLAENDNVAMQIYNLAGQKVAELSKNLEAGTHTFDVSLRVSQVYLCAVQTSQGRSTVKLITAPTQARMQFRPKE